MERTLLYSIELFIPTNIRYTPLFEECKKLNITWDKGDSTRLYTFYCEKQKSLRSLQIRFCLKTKEHLYNLKRKNK